MARIAREGLVLAFEPVPENCAHLRRTFPGVHVHEVALWDREEPTLFHHVIGRPARSSLRRQSYPDPREAVVTFPVRTTTLDRALADQPRVDFIKIDVEGAELPVLRGGQGAIRAHKPLIVFEHAAKSSAAFGATSTAVYDFLVTECGMRLSNISRWLVDAPPLERSAFLDEVATRRTLDFLAY
jgi:FkbM family methyltransferase